MRTELAATQSGDGPNPQQRAGSAAQLHDMLPASANGDSQPCGPLQSAVPTSQHDASKSRPRSAARCPESDSLSQERATLWLWSGRSGVGGVKPLYFQELFDHMGQEHGLTLCGSEMHEIAIICARREAKDRQEEAALGDAQRRLETARLNYEPRVEALDWMEQMLIHCPDAIVRYNEDPDVEDKLGMVPVGFSIRGDGCQGSFCVVDDSLHSVLLRDKAQVAILNGGRTDASVAWRAAAAGESPKP